MIKKKLTERRVNEVRVRLTVEEHKKLKKLSKIMDIPMAHVFIELLNGKEL